MRILHTLTFFIVCALSAACQDSQQTHNPLADMGPPQIVASGFISTEGPVWDAASGRLIFSDIPGDTIYALNVDSGQVDVLRSPSQNANGLTLFQGDLLMAEQASREITRMNLTTKAVTPFISSVMNSGEARKFNSPNDMAVHKSGAVFFTDPPFAIRRTPALRELNYNGVFKRGVDGKVTLIKSFGPETNPNGLILNPDHSLLYLAVSDDVSGPILAFDVDEAGVFSGEREFSRAQNADGMAMDAAGNLYVATRTGIEAFAPDGKGWGKITIMDVKGAPIRTTNAAFGGEDLSTLYITGRSENLYAVKLAVP